MEQGKLKLKREMIRNPVKSKAEELRVLENRLVDLDELIKKLYQTGHIDERLLGHLSSTKDGVASEIASLKAQEQK